VPDRPLTCNPDAAFPFLEEWSSGLARSIQKSVDSALTDPSARADWQAADGLHRNATATIFVWLAGLDGSAPHYSLPDLCRHEPVAIRIRDGLELWTQPHPVFIEMIRTSGRGSRRLGSELANFMSPDDSSWPELIQTIREATDLLVEHAPGFWSDAQVFTSAIAVVDQNAAFRGASGLVHHGLSFFSPDGWDAVIWAEELLHESTHNLLDAIDVQTSLVETDTAMTEIFDAPLRPDPRPLFGVFHALVVLARVVRFQERLIEWSPTTSAAVIDRRTDNVRLAKAALPSVIQHRAVLSELGRTILDAIVVETFEKI
jgi:hypothetical protein